MTRRFPTARERDLLAELDDWREHSMRWESLCDRYRDIATTQARHIKELEAIAREAIDRAVNGFDPHDPR